MRTTNHKTKEIEDYLKVIGKEDVTTVSIMFRNAAAIFFLGKGFKKIELEEVFGLHHQYITRAQQLIKLNYNKNKDWTNKFDKEMNLLMSKEYLLY